MSATNNTTRSKWGQALDSSGFQAAPNLPLSQQPALGLSNTEIVGLLHLNRFWWQRDGDPLPKPARIAAQIDVHRRSVERSLKKLEQRGLIEQKGPQETSSGIVRPTSLLPLANTLVRKADQLRSANRSLKRLGGQVQGDQPDSRGPSSKEVPF